MTHQWTKSVRALIYVRPKGLITEGVICITGGGIHSFISVDLENQGHVKIVQ